jgi:hypothetical protein
MIVFSPVTTRLITLTDKEWPTMLLACPEHVAKPLATFALRPTRNLCETSSRYSATGGLDGAAGVAERQRLRIQRGR